MKSMTLLMATAAIAAFAIAPTTLFAASPVSSGSGIATTPTSALASTTPVTATLKATALQAALAPAQQFGLKSIAAQNVGIKATDAAHNAITATDSGSALDKQKVQRATDSAAPAFVTIIAKATSGPGSAPAG